MFGLMRRIWEMWILKDINQINSTILMINLKKNAFIVISSLEYSQI